MSEVNKENISTGTGYNGGMLSTISATVFDIEDGTKKKEEENLNKDESQGGNTRTMQLATTDLDALLHVVKSSLGTGMLAMPFAFKHAGLLEGLVATIFVGIVCSHGTHLLVKSSQDMCAKLKKSSLGYAKTVEAVFENSPHIMIKNYAPLARKIVNLFLFLTYYGSNTAYVVIIAATFQEVAKHAVGCDWNIRWYMLILIIPLLLIGTIRSMKYLVPFSMLANLLLLAGVIFTFYYILQDLPPITSRPQFITLTKFPIFFSTVICGLEGIGTILPIENSMKKPHHFLGCPGVLNIAMTLVVSLFSSVGFFGYWKYGDIVKDSITLSLPREFIGSSVKILVGLAILFTFGLQMTAVMEVVWSYLHKRIDKNNINLAYYITRAILVIITVFSAVAVPQLGPVISLVGAVGFSTLGLLIPALVDTIVLSDNGLNLKDWQIWKNIIMMSLSVFALIAGSYLSVQTIIEEYS